MKRPLILALALLLVTASAVDARPRKPHPHAAVVPGNDIAVSDTTFPGDALITYTYVEDDGAPWARVDCIALDGPSAGTVGLSQYEHLDGINDRGVDLSFGGTPEDGPESFAIGPTPSWAGGDAACHVQMLSLNGLRDPVLLAETDFSVEGGS